MCQLLHEEDPWVILIKIILIFLSFRKGKRSDGYAQYKSYFNSELETPILVQNYPTEKETLEGILDLLAETCSSKRKTIRIAGDDKPIEVVKSRLMKLNSMHIQYVLDCLHENTTYVRDMKQYLLTTLFNAPVTIDSYYHSAAYLEFHADSDCNGDLSGLDYCRDRSN